MRVRLGKQDGGLDGESRIAITGEANEEIGFVEFGVRDGWLDVRWIELAAEHRRWGLGAEAVRLLEVETAERWGVMGVRAHVPRDVGLALYFWLRLGYRPEAELGGSSSGAIEEGTMCLVRTLDEVRGQKSEVRGRR
jgi:ribosomal protein S18 acetylase RimI-like enzyme